MLRKIRIWIIWLAMNLLPESLAFVMLDITLPNWQDAARKLVSKWKR